MKTILHIDFDSFFASVEQQCNPHLRERPIGVTAAHSRTAVIAASHEAKAMGVKGGSSSYDALKLCPQLQLVPAHFTRYFEISKKFINICKLYSPDIEVFSIDELFIDITTTAHLFGGTEGLVKKLKQQIKEGIGTYITVSIGVSHNKLLAKLASGLEKPNGLTYITPETLDSVYAKVALTDICGIGQRIAKRLEMLGIKTLLALRKVPFSALRAEFGPHEAVFLQQVAWGNDNTPLSHFGNSTETKSVGRNYALAKNETNKRIILQTIFELYEEVAVKLRKLHKKGRTIALFFHGDTQVHIRKTITFYTSSAKEMFDVMRSQGLYRLVSETVYVRQISVWVSNLSDGDVLQASLFESHTAGITDVVDKVNERFGDHTIRNGFLLYSDTLTTVPNGFLADRLERQELRKLYDSD